MFCLAVVSKDLGRSHTTISREILRNTGLRGYRHKQADYLTAERHVRKPKLVKITNEIKILLGVCLRNNWSPEQISGRLHNEGIVSLHHETVYQFILTDKSTGRQLYKHLRHQGKTYQKTLWISSQSYWYSQPCRH